MLLYILNISYLNIYFIFFIYYFRLCISKILWGIQGFIDIFQLIMVPIGIKVLKGSSNICVNIYKYIVYIRNLFFFFFFFFFFFLPDKMYYKL